MLCTEGQFTSAIDYVEVYILDPLNVKTILLAYEVGDFTPALRMMTGKCKFNTVKRILMTLNTNGEGRDQETYDNIGGVLCVFCSFCCV